MRPFRAGGGAAVAAGTTLAGPSGSAIAASDDDPLVDDDPERLPGGSLDSSASEDTVLSALLGDGFPLVGLIVLVVLLGVATRMLLRARAASRG